MICLNLTRCTAKANSLYAYTCIAYTSKLQFSVYNNVLGFASFLFFLYNFYLFVDVSICGFSYF